MREVDKCVGSEGLVTIVGFFFLLVEFRKLSRIISRSIYFTNCDYTIILCEGRNCDACGVKTKRNGLYFVNYCTRFFFLKSSWFVCYFVFLFL